MVIDQHTENISCLHSIVSLQRLQADVLANNVVTQTTQLYSTINAKLIYAYARHAGYRDESRFLAQQYLLGTQVYLSRKHFRT